MPEPSRIAGVIAISLLSFVRFRTTSRQRFLNSLVNRRYFRQTTAGGIKFRHGVEGDWVFSAGS